MSAAEENPLLDEFTRKEYEFGFTTDIGADKVAPGLNEEVIRLISAKKKEPAWMLEWRLDAFRVWQSMEEPDWAHVQYEKPDYQAISYYLSLIHI